MLERQKENLKNLKSKSNSKVEEILVQTLYIIFFVLYNLFEMYLVYLIGKYSNKVGEILLIVLCFFINKAMYGKPLHFRDNLKCLGVSLLLFYAATQCAFTLGLSIIVNVMIGVLCGSITSYIATYLYSENKEMKKRNLVKELVELDLDNDKIQEICKKNGLDEEIGFIVDFRLNHNEDLTCYEFEIERMTLNRKLNTFLRAAKNK